MHCCCGPCATACIERLYPDYDLTLLFYNPNIDTAEEYGLRAGELKRFALGWGIAPEHILVPAFDPRPFYAVAAGLENEPEGGARCEQCIGLRLRYTAEQTAGYDFFTTTLSISPHKNAATINRLGEGLDAGGASHGAKWLHSDFKKRDGFKRSIELSKQFCLYRQNYCGCVFGRRGER